VCSASTSKNAVIDGLRIISSRPNGDGITLQSCENYLVQNCFVRSWDDSLVVKNYTGDSKNITFRDNQLWTDLAQSMEIGYETNKGKKEEAKISGITFENITVLNNFHKPVISVHNADDALIDDITFHNIIVENAQMGSGDGEELPYLIDFNIAQSSNWSSTKERGQIRNVVIDGVKVLFGKFNPSRIQGFDETHTVEDITIKNLEILGEKITSFEQGQFEINETSTKNLILE
jgi:polygalacturonase